MEHFFINERLLPLAADESTLIFHPHAARTAGRTFREEVLIPALGAEHVYCRQTVLDWKSWEDLTDKDLRGFRAYTDLRDFQVIRVKRPLVCIGVLRHPLYRMVSLYWFIRRNAEHRHHEQARKYPLEEFYRIASDEHPSYFRNVQCHRICGQDDAKLALDFIRSKYIAVGFTNQLTEFVRKLCEIFHWPPIELKTMPPDAERYDSQITPRFRETVLSESAEDLALFETVAGGLALKAPGASFVKRAGYLTGIIPAMARQKRNISRFLKGRSRRRAERFSQARKKQLRQERRMNLRMERAGDVKRSAPPGAAVCNLCGVAQTEGPDSPIKRICPNCKSSERQRSFPALFNTALAPLFAKTKPRDALILSPGSIERKLLEPHFESVTVSSLYNTYKGNFVRADVRDLAPFQEGSFDYVQACNVLEYVPEMGDALSAIARVLRPKGTFCFHIIDGRLLPGSSDVTVTYRTKVPVDYFPKGFAVPAARVGRDTLKALLTASGLNFETFEIEDPLTKTICTWWLCTKLRPEDAPSNGELLSASE